MPRPSPGLCTSKGSNWSPVRQLSAIQLAILVLILSGCSTLNVKAPEFQLPPIPEALMQPCPALEPLPDGKMATLYLALLSDAATYQTCSRRQAALAAVVKYQEQVRVEYQKTLSNPKPWYQFW